MLIYDYIYKKNRFFFSRAMLDVRRCILYTRVSRLDALYISISFFYFSLYSKVQYRILSLRVCVIYRFITYICTVKYIRALHISLNQKKKKILFIDSLYCNKKKIENLKCWVKFSTKKFMMITSTHIIIYVLTLVHINTNFKAFKKIHYLYWDRGIWGKVKI